MYISIAIQIYFLHENLNVTGINNSQNTLTIHIYV